MRQKGFISRQKNRKLKRNKNASENIPKALLIRKTAVKTSTNYIKIMAKGIVTGKHWKTEWDCVYSEYRGVGRCVEHQTLLSILERIHDRIPPEWRVLIKLKSI